MAFATAIKPLTEGMLGADTLLKFVVYMCPSMLKYALPFAAAMGVTLVYMRMVQDNEMLACQASGISHRRLLAPVFLLGGALMVTLLVLSGWIAPALYRKAAQTAQGDVMHALVQKMNNGESFKFDGEGGSVMLFANKAASHDPPAGLSTDPDLQAESVITLSGVAVGKLNEDGWIESEITASSATAVLYRDIHSGDGLVAIRLENTEVSDAVSGAGRAKAVDGIRLPMRNPVGDKMEFFSVPQLAGLLTHPEYFDKVRKAREELSKVVAIERFRRSVAASLKSGVPLRGPLGGEFYTVSAPGFATAQNGILQLSADGAAKVVVEHKDGAASPMLRRWEAESGQISFRLDPESDEPVAVLSLKAVRVQDPRKKGVVSAKSEHTFDALAWPGALLADVQHMGAAQWLESTEKAAQEEPQGALAEARTNLFKQTKDLRRRVVAQFHERASNSAACLLLAVLGALMSLWRRGSMPLVVYFWCFMLAVASLITINTGANMARASQARFGAGLALLWLPILLQAVLAMVILRRLRRPGG